MYCISVYNKKKDLIYCKEFHDSKYLARFKNVVKSFEDNENEFYMKVYNNDNMIMDVFYRIIDEVQPNFVDYR